MTKVESKLVPSLEGSGLGLRLMKEEELTQGWTEEITEVQRVKSFTPWGGWCAI
jgi:hypothetical protein